MSQFVTPAFVALAALVDQFVVPESELESTSCVSQFLFRVEFEFESNSESRSNPTQIGGLGHIWTPFWMFEYSLER